MIEKISFTNYRNLDGKTYTFKDNLSVVIGKNGDGKTNILEGIKLAFSSFDGSYMRVNKSDFKNSDDSTPITIAIKLKPGSIPSFNLPQVDGKNICGFQIVISRMNNGYYRKRFYNYDGTNINSDVVTEDSNIPKTYMVPMIRIEDIYSPGLTTKLENFMDEAQYLAFRNQINEGITNQISRTAKNFRDLCRKFNKSLDITVSDPEMNRERLYVVDGKSEHNLNIGSGYKSIANIVLCSMGGSSNIILIDEVENHIHPALLRSLINELRVLKNTFILMSTHSPVVINEFTIEDIIDAQIGNLCSVIKDEKIRRKINTFLHPGRAELLLADNVVLVEGFTEELILRNYIVKRRFNWTVVNVAGVMFEPYIKLCAEMKKKVVVVSDDDRVQGDNGDASSQRFENLQEICQEKSIKLVQVYNTLESDLYKNGYLNADEFIKLIKVHEKYQSIYIAKDKKKVEIVQKLLESGTDLSNWHVVQEIENELKGD